VPLSDPVVPSIDPSVVLPVLGSGVSVVLGSVDESVAEGTVSLLPPLPSSVEVSFPVPEVPVGTGAAAESVTGGTAALLPPLPSSGRPVDSGEAGSVEGPPSGADTGGTSVGWPGRPVSMPVGPVAGPEGEGGFPPPP